MKTINEVVAIIEEAIEPKLQQIHENTLQYYSRLYNTYMKCVYETEQSEEFKEKRNDIENLHNQRIERIRYYISNELFTDDYNESYIDELIKSKVDVINQHFGWFAKNLFLRKMGCRFIDESKKNDNNIEKRYQSLIYQFRDLHKYNLMAESNAVQNVLFAKAKLNACVVKYLSKYESKIHSVEMVEAQESPKGLEVLLKIKTIDNETLMFKTTCIDAGGYNIQEFHYRYICSVKVL